MRTAVVRVNVDPTRVLSPGQLREGMAALQALDADVVNGDPGRELELLIETDDVESAKRAAIELCGKAFNTSPLTGVVTFVSRGTDDDARGVLSAFGLSGEIRRETGDDGFDIVYVTLREDDIDRVPESRIHTALEASLNCEVHIRTR